MNANEIVDMGAGTYHSPRELPDGTWCCLAKMLYTWALIVGIDEGGYHHRFCFEHKDDAKRELDKMESIDSEPSGYIVRK